MTTAANGAWKRAALGLAARWGGRWMSGNGAPRVAILNYHSIHPEKRFRSATPELFERHLDWLRLQVDVIRFEQVLEAASRPRTRPAVAITFDDGYADNYEYAYPALVRHSFPATFFLTAGLLDKDSAVVDRFRAMRASDYEAIRPLAWRQVREMHRAGMSIGAHTYSHPNLAGLSRGDAYRELVQARRVIEDRLGEAVHAVAYPCGAPGKHVTPQTMELAAAAGFEYAAMVWFRAVDPSDSPFGIPRFDVSHDTEGVLWQKLHGWWDYVGWWQKNRRSWTNPTPPKPYIWENRKSA